MNVEHVGVQLYTLRAMTQMDMLGTLRHVADIGYQAVELAGYGNSTPGEIRAVLDEIGVRVCAAHVGLEQLEQRSDAVIAEMQTLGCQYVVVPWIGEDYRGDLVRIRYLADRLNTEAQRLQTHGLHLAYHNHDFEFAPLQGTTMWETLVAETDSALVDFELDVYWVAVAGRDPEALITQHAERLKLLHLKDRSLGTGGSFAPVGSGWLPWERILRAARGTQWFIVEQDTSATPLDDVRLSWTYLHGTTGG